jgi:hypothetical protein
MRESTTATNLTEDELRVLVRSNPAVWLETCGYIRDVSGRKRRPRANVLQQRIEALYVSHLKRNQPLRSIGLKPRKRGYSTMVAAIHHAQINNFRHGGVIIGNKLETSDTVYRMMVYYGQNDDFRECCGGAIPFTGHSATDYPFWAKPMPFNQ